MLKYIADITILAVEIICYLIFFGIFARGKKIKVKQKISAICLLISIVYVCVHFLKNYTIVKLLMIMLTMLIVIRFLYEISAIKTIILTLLIQGIIGVIDYIVIMIVTARYNIIAIIYFHLHSLLHFLSNSAIYSFWSHSISLLFIMFNYISYQHIFSK